jgi:hypothetical protein
MNKREKLLRDIETLRESIRQESVDMHVRFIVRIVVDRPERPDDPLPKDAA